MKLKLLVLVLFIVSIGGWAYFAPKVFGQTYNYMYCLSGSAGPSCANYYEAACTLGGTYLTTTGCTDDWRGNVGGSVYSSDSNGFNIGEIAVNHSFDLVMAFENASSAGNTWLPGKVFVSANGGLPWWGVEPVPLQWNVYTSTDCATGCPGPNVLNLGPKTITAPVAPTTPTTYNFKYQLYYTPDNGTTKHWFGPTINYPVVVFPQTKIYIDPSNTVAVGQSGIQLTATTASAQYCGTANYSINSGGGLSCTAGTVTCPGSNPKSGLGDTNHCYVVENCTATNAGSYSAEYFGSTPKSGASYNDQCSETVSYTVVGQPPTPSVSAPTLACTPSGGTSQPGIVTISWGSTSPAVSVVDISDNSGFSTFYNKAVSGNSTTAPDGFASFWNGSAWVSQQLSLQPGQTYYVRTWNGYLHSNTVSFTMPAVCPPTTANVTMHFQNNQGAPIANTAFFAGTGAGVFCGLSGYASTGTTDGSGNISIPNVPINTAFCLRQSVPAQYQFSSVNPAPPCYPVTGHTATDTGNMCSEWQNVQSGGDSYVFTYLTTPPTPSISSPSIACTPSGGTSLNGIVTISWGATNPAVQYVDISQDSTFNTKGYHKQIIPNVNGTNASGTSTTAPDWFAGFTSDVSGQPLILQPGTRYYVRSWNGELHSTIVSFTMPAACAPLTVSCSGTPLNVGSGSTVNWTAVPSGGSNGYYYAWSGPSTTNSSSTYQTTGNYYPVGNVTVNVQVADNVGELASNTCSVTVVNPTAPSVSAVGVCLPSGDQSGSESVTWTNPSVNWVDISPYSNFKDPANPSNDYYYHKAIASGFSTTAPDGFNGVGDVSGILTFQQNTKYYVRTYNGYTNSNVGSFTTKFTCLSASACTFTPSTPTTQSTVYWGIAGLSGGQGPFKFYWTGNAFTSLTPTPVPPPPGNYTKDSYPSGTYANPGTYSGNVYITSSDGQRYPPSPNTIACGPVTVVRAASIQVNGDTHSNSNISVP